MAERECIVHKLRLTYEGLFSVKDLYKLIDDWFHEKNYDKKEIRNIERVAPEGKYLEIELMPWRKISDYAKYEIQIRLICSNVKEVEVEKDGLKTRMNQGKVHIVFDAFLTTDYEDRWESKAVYMFVRTIYNKYIYEPWMSGFQSGVKKDLMELHDRVKAYLNLQRF